MSPEQEEGQERGRLRPPGLGLLLAEARGLFELNASLLLSPVLMRAPRGDGHPVLALPGFLASDLSMAPMRRYLKELGYDTYAWNLGRNLGGVASKRDALRALTRSLGREPSEPEAANALGLSLDDYQQYLLAESAEEMLSFDEVLQEAVGAENHTPGPEDAYMVRRSLEQALAKLNEKEQRVIQMIYEFELSYKEIAAVLDLSDARVCQLNKSALAKMNTALRRD